MRCQFCHNPDSWKTGVGEEWSADDLLDKAERFKSYWGDKGGITVSGGEALMQIDFLIELFEKHISVASIPVLIPRRNHLRKKENSLRNSSV